MSGGCTPKMKGCKTMCGHRLIVDTYRQERERQESVAEEVTLGYAREYGEYVRDNPLLTFKNYLIGMRR